jgi:hypothetical protein
MRSFVVSAVTFLMLVAFAPAGEAATITFDEFGNVGTNGPTVDNQYAALGVLFSSAGGQTNMVTTQASFNSTKPNFICTGFQTISCTGETILDFTTPVSNLMFHGMGINDVAADIAHIDIFTNGVFADTFILAGNAEVLDPRVVDLSAFIDVTKIRIYNITDAAGIGWDTFSFESGTTAVPEPAALLLLGAGLVGAVRRRRAKRA